MLNKKALAGTASAAPVFIDELFSTYLYTGTGASQTITNGIDLSGKGGLVWLKKRGASTGDHCLDDTVRGNLSVLHTNTTGAAQIGNGYNDFGDFTSTGFTMDYTAGNTNVSGSTYASWTFRKQPKFFDVVTYTGNGTAGRTISHNLGSVPGMMIVKRTDTTAAWQVYHRSLANTEYLVLNTTAAKATGATRWNSTTPTSSVFSLGTDTTVNASGGTYVAYLFAHNAGGFGLTGTDNAISCGTFTTDGSANAIINLGYEPQYVLMKSTAAGNWQQFDIMSGFAQTQVSILHPNTTETQLNLSGNYIFPTATGFQLANSPYGTAGETYIYMAIRRPMKVPTTGTEVFSPVKQTFNGTTVTNTGFVVDMVINKNGVATTGNNFVLDRLRGSDNSTGQQTLSTNDTGAEVASGGRVALTGTTTIQNGFLEQDTTANNIVWAFSRRPGFFDEVCYTGTGSATTVAHNLGVVPELMIVKVRNDANQWVVYHKDLGNGKWIALQSVDGEQTNSTVWNNTSPTSSVFTVGTFSRVNASAGTYVAYLFATLAGVSKVGSYTGNGSTQAISCGFTGGARFVLIKRTDSTGDWYVYDTARGMTVLTDPYLLLNSTAAEAATLGSVTTTTGGFTVNASILAAINTNAASYIFLAIS